MRKRCLCVLFVLLLVLISGCKKDPPQPAASETGVPSAPVEEVRISGLPEMGRAADRVPMTLRLENPGAELHDLQVLLIWRFYDPNGEPVNLETLPDRGAEEMLGLDEAPECCGPVLQRETAVIELPLRELPAGAAAELPLPLPGDDAQTVRTDLFVRSGTDAPRELFCTWWQYSAEGTVLPAWEDVPALPTLESTDSLSWELRDGSAILTGIGSWPLSCLYIPDTVRLTEVPARTVTVIASEVKGGNLFSGLGKEYWLERPDGTLIKDREELLQRNETVSRMLVIKGKTFPKHVIRGLEFPALVLADEDGLVLTPNNVNDVVTAEEYSEDHPLILQVLPSSGTCLIEDPVAGQSYLVLVRGNAFAGCSALRSVRFSSASTLENRGMNYLNVGMFSGCTALEEVLCFPAEIASMEGAFLGCTALERIEGLPERTDSLKETFLGCTALRSLPPLPAGASTLERCFSGCTALDTPPVIGSGAVDLTECFMDCTALTQPPILPEGVETMVRTFQNCTALLSAPELPETVADLTRCFTGCAALGGEITVPSRALTPTSLMELNLNISGCPHLEAVRLQYCGFRQYPKSLPGNIPVIADCTHVEDALCPYCHYANLETEIDGLPVIFDAVYEPYYLAAVDYLDNDVPAFLKDSCTQLLFTEDMDRYYHDSGLGVAVREVAGFAAEGNACVRTYSFEQVGRVSSYVEHTIIHELAHCYDFDTDGLLRSQSEQWRALYSEEGDTVSQYYGPAYQTYPRSVRIIESYAIAVECYCLIPDELSRVCPGMYAFLRENLPKEG